MSRSFDHPHPYRVDECHLEASPSPCRSEFLLKVHHQRPNVLQIVLLVQEDLLSDVFGGEVRWYVNDESGGLPVFAQDIAIDEPTLVVDLVVDQQKSLGGRGRG